MERPSRAGLFHLERSIGSFSQELRTLLLVLGLFLTSASQAKEQVLIEEDLPLGPVKLEVFSAEIKVFLEAGSQGYLRVTAPEGTSADQTAIEMVAGLNSSSVLRLQSPATTDGPKLPNLSIDLILPTQDGLSISGNELQISIEQVTPELEATSPEPNSTELSMTETSAQDLTQSPSEESPTQDAPVEAHLPDALNLEVTSSSVDLWGIGHLVLQAQQSEVHLEHSTGTANLTLTDSNAEARGHQGDLILAGEGSNLDLVDCDGKLQLDWKTGNLTVQEGTGAITGQTQDALVQIEGQQGAVSLRGNGSTISCRDSLAPDGVFKIQGEDLQTILESWRGAVDFRLVRGSLRGSEWVGKGTLIGNGGTVLDVQDLRGEFNLRVQNGSESRIDQALGRLTAIIQKSSLTVDGAQRFDLTAVESQASINGVERLVRLTARDSELDLDFSASRDRRVKLDLKGSSQADIVLASPCIVELANVRAVDDSGIDISGCELKRQGEGRRRNAPLRVDGSPMTHLIVTSSTESEIRVEGQ